MAVDFVTLQNCRRQDPFYTFATISYVIDISAELPATHDLPEFGCSSRIFHTWSGPILRASRSFPDSFARHVTAKRLTDSSPGILKVFVADNVAGLTSAVFNADRTPGGVNVLVGVRSRSRSTAISPLLEHRPRRQADGHRAAREFPFPISSARLRSPGDTGTSACPRGSATIYAFRLAATGDPACRPGATC